MKIMIKRWFDLSMDAMFYFLRISHEIYRCFKLKIVAASKLNGRIWVGL